MMTTRENTRGKKRPDYIDMALGQLSGKPLTRRETQVVAGKDDGDTTNERIGAALVITTKTVQTHLFHIYAKTGAADKADLILMVMGRKACAVDLSNIIWR